MPELQSPPLEHGRLPALPTLILAFLVLALTGCASSGEAAPDARVGVEVEVSAVSRPFSRVVDRGDECTGAFAPRDLQHTTTGRGVITAMSDGTGAGVLLEDLDQDGLIDIVLPNLTGETSVLWNAGDLTFDRQPLAVGRFRQAVAADVNADGSIDVLLTTGIGPPISMIANGDRSFTRQEFRTSAVTYSASVGDLDGDGTLRVITGSYNAELTQNRDPRALTGYGVGIAVHDISDETITTEFLTERAQALVTMIVDLDDDDRQDVIVGNDLGTPDGIWRNAASTTESGQGHELIPATPFETTTLSTMSIDVVDLDNDGDSDVIATDMAPMADEDQAPWLAVASDIESAMIDDVQEPRNKLQIQGEDGYEDVAPEFGVEATGWSWSGIAGDLDNDGLVDLYVVNGMQATSIFENLPDGALIEENQAFRNTGDGMEPAPQWAMAQTSGGRGMAQADLDDDGDLDVVINNLGQPSVLLENRICGGASLVVDPVWADVQNGDALGATVTVAAGDKIISRQIISNRGYLSSPPTEAHLGLGDETGPVEVRIMWPDGAHSIIEDMALNQHLTVERSAPPVAEEAP